MYKKDFSYTTSFKLGLCNSQFVMTCHIIFKNCECFKNTYRLIIQQYQLFLSHLILPWKYLVDQENVCLKTYFISEKCFINCCMCNKYLYMCLFIHKRPPTPNFCLWEAFFLALLGCFLQIYFSSLIQTRHIYPTYTPSIFSLTQIQILKNIETNSAIFNKYFLIGCPTANFGSLLRGQPHLISHRHSYQKFKGTQGSRGVSQRGGAPKLG